MVATQQHVALLPCGARWSCFSTLTALLLVVSVSIILALFSTANIGVPAKNPAPGEGSMVLEKGTEERKPPRCDLFSGTWVYDNSSAYPLYSEKDCPFMSGIVACEKYGRKDLRYQKWRWQPHACNLPRFNARTFLEKLRGKRLVFVGDSLNWNQWVSLTCLVESSIPASQRIHQPSGSLKTFMDKEYNASIEHYWAPLLVESNSDDPIKNQFPDRIIRAESIKKHAIHWMNADIVVFNSYLWWRRSKIKVLWGSFNDTDGIYKEVDALRSFELALKTWADWLEFNVNPSKTKLFFMSLSPTHFWGDEWGVDGSRNCYSETDPITKQGYRGKGSDVRMMQLVEESISGLRSRGVEVQVLNVTQLSEYRKDGHPSIYRERWETLTAEQLANPSSYSDCIHWCLPGVPDVWNELLYAYIVSDDQEKLMGQN